MQATLEIITAELWGHLLGEHGLNPDQRTQDINQQMHYALEAGFGVFERFHEPLRTQDGFSAIRKYLASGADKDHPTQDTVILVVENLLHPSTNYNSRNSRDRYDIAGDMETGEHTFHPNVAAQLRMHIWRGNPNRQEGTPWHGDIRIRYWGEVLSIARVNDYGWGRNFTSVTFPVNREDPFQTSQHIKQILEAAKPQILAGYRHLL